MSASRILKQSNNLTQSILSKKVSKKSIPKRSPQKFKAQQQSKGMYKGRGQSNRENEMSEQNWRKASSSGVGSSSLLDGVENGESSRNWGEKYQNLVQTINVEAIPPISTVLDTTASVEASEIEEDSELSKQIIELYHSKKASPQSLRNRDTLINQLSKIFNNYSWIWPPPPWYSPDSISTSSVADEEGRRMAWREHDYQEHPIKIEAFGSIRFGLATSTSDLDLVILDPYRPNGFVTDTDSVLPEVYNVAAVTKRLRKAGFKNVTPVAHAKVPIVKFEAYVNGECIQADICTNERLGLLNSLLISDYSQLVPVLAPLTIIVKSWAKSKKLNDPSGSEGPASFSSYSLVLMLIFYLQKKVGAMNLQDERLIAVVNERYFEEGKQSGRNEEGREYFWTRGRENRRTKVRPPGSKLDITSINSDEFLDIYPHHFQKRDSDLGDLLIGFFKFYTEEFNFEKDVITISKSGVERELRYSISPTQLPERHKETGPTEKVELLEELEGMNLSDLMGMEEMPSDRRLREEALVAGPQGQPINWEQFPIIIQDPFVIDRNTALMVTDRVFGRFIDEMKLAKGLLESSLQPGSSILLSQLFGKAPRQPRLNQASRRRGEETESKSNFNTNGQSKSQSTASQSEKVSERPAHLLAKIPSKTSSNTSTRPSSPPKSMDLPPHLSTVIKATNNPSTAAKVVEAQSEENSKVTANAQRQRKDRRPKPAKQEIETLQPRAVESRLDGMAL